MKNIESSFLLTIIAGLSTIIGYFIIFIKANKEKIIAFSLSFSSSVMITISLIDLIPSSFNYLNNYVLFFKILLFLFFFIIGIYLSYFISHRIDNKKNSLKKIGIITMFTIILHNIPEGIITFMVSGVNISLGIKLAIAIGMHNIPEGISIAIPLYYGNNNKLKTFIVVLIAGLSETLGAIICFLFLKDYINNFIIGITFAFISGMMLNISIRDLLPESLKYKKKKITIIGFLLGIIVILISHFL